MEKKYTGLMVEKLSNGYLIGIMGENRNLFGRTANIGDTQVAETEKKAMEIVSKLIKRLEANTELETTD